MLFTRSSAFLSGLFALASHVSAESMDAFAETARPFLEQHCLSCHGPDKQKGKLRLDTLGRDFTDPLVAEKWTEVVNAMNARDMPPEDEPQPTDEAAGKFADLLAAELGRAEIAKRSTRVVLRRMNRAEYDNTIRDLVGVDFHPADKFPEDPPAGGFDNIGQALTMSPMQVELYYAAARQILDRALVEGEQPAAIKWRFEPEDDTEGGDRTRVKRDGQNIILNRGENPVENGFTVVHHEAWNKGINFRDFTVPTAGEYILRFRAAGRIPGRAEVVKSARPFLDRQRQEEDARNPGRSADYQRSMNEQMRHFETARTYDYGPPRVKITQALGGTPRTIAEMDVPAPESAPAVYEVRVHFSTENASIVLEQAYEVTRSLENWQFIGKDEFARPTLLVDWLELEGPIHASWPPPSHRRVLADAALEKKDELASARAVLTRFMTRAYRRPLRPGEVEAKLALFEKLRPEKPSFVEAIKVPLAAVLASPHFLYLVEPEAPADAPRALDAFELASRLSYFLWSSMPDDELFRLAADGRLLESPVLRAQATRMIADPKSEAFVKNFAGQWLGLRKVGTNPPAKNLYPEYDRHLELSIVRETEAFFAEVLRHDLDARNLIKSNFVTINERLARFYGIPGVKGDAMRRVPVPAGVNRGGLVTQASIQSITSNGTRTSPVVRGTWVLKTLLGSDPGLPVANVGEIASKVPGIDKATVRQRLAIHREAASCARCHDKIDPLGLALENFDAAGQWRDREGHGYEGRIEPNDPLIDASAKMPDGAEFVGVAGLQEQLLKKDDLFLNSLASQLYTYALGRELGFSDRPTVKSSVTAMKRDGHRLRALLLDIVQSDLFTTK
ncbi:DUF1592 domain-containing protein [Luteolibacter arcticus]|uniref:DUF1592 domain-containing protein n=1 Tax=Luteolibacter arcticus TaxID=1581411 RepID=A0ABT3GNI2_9BACT|nr:DUF1592 domain-containing protein [Luteolibacter arcticus]MCW1925025.1 DUF1592 domain-containing protein [Luteolibacter arcticus]